MKLGMKDNLLLILISTCLFCMLKNKETSNPSLSDSTLTLKNDSTQNINESKVKTELKLYNGLPTDSMFIKYNKTTDTIYGVREDDKLIVEGDMKFTYPIQFFKNENINKQKDETHKISPTILKHITGVGTLDRHWDRPNGIITLPYIINPYYKSPQNVLIAIKMWERYGFIKFIPFTSENDFIEFVPSNATQSDVGRVGNHQTIEIDSNAITGNIAHEIGHVLGLFHEQSRSDRTKYIRILCPENINYKFAFQIDSSPQNIGPYDFFSIMHYRIDDCLKVQVPGLPPNIPGQRDSVSAGDFLSIKQLYNLK